MKDELTITLPLPEYDRMILKIDELQRKVDELNAYIQRMPLFPEPITPWPYDPANPWGLGVTNTGDPTYVSDHTTGDPDLIKPITTTVPKGGF